MLAITYEGSTSYAERLTIFPGEGSCEVEWQGPGGFSGGYTLCGLLVVGEVTTDGEKGEDGQDG